MTSPSRLKIGVRSGRLAGAIANEVEEALKQAHPSLAIEWVKVTASGDHVHDRARAGGVFTAELDEALRERRIDAALHDLPDVPAVRPDAFVLAAVPRRRHPIDVVLTPDGRILDELEAGERVGASSASRRAQMLAYRDDIKSVAAKGGLDAHWKHPAG